LDVSAGHRDRFIVERPVRVVSYEKGMVTVMACQQDAEERVSGTELPADGRQNFGPNPAQDSPGVAPAGFVTAWRPAWVSGPV
jgi:hypothetical protein